MGLALTTALLKAAPTRSPTTIFLPRKSRVCRACVPLVDVPRLVPPTTTLARRMMTALARRPRTVARARRPLTTCARLSSTMHPVFSTSSRCQVALYLLRPTTIQAPHQSTIPSVSSRDARIRRPATLTLLPMWQSQRVLRRSRAVWTLPPKITCHQQRSHAPLPILANPAELVAVRSQATRLINHPRLSMMALAWDMLLVARTLPSPTTGLTRRLTTAPAGWAVAPTLSHRTSTRRPRLTMAAVHRS